MKYLLEPFYSFVKDVRVVSVVVAELELGDVQWQIFGADLVKFADHAALENRPEAFNRVCVDCTDDVLALGMIDDAMRVFGVQAAISDTLIGAKQAHLFRNGAAHEALKGSGIDAANHAGDHVSLPANRADDGRFAGTNTASSAAPAALIPMPVLRLAADEGFIDLDDAHELAEVLTGETGADAVTHVPSGLVRAETHVAVDLQCADPLLARQHKVDDAEPVAQRLIRVLEDRSDDRREAVVGRWQGARVAQIIPFHRPVRFYLGAAAARTHDELGPAVLGEVEFARVFVREQLLEIDDRHLVDGLTGLLFPCHSGVSVAGSDYSGIRSESKVRDNR
jgi:hypothetical protein